MADGALTQADLTAQRATDRLEVGQRLLATAAAVTLVLVTVIHWCRTPNTYRVARTYDLWELAERVDGSVYVTVGLQLVLALATFVVTVRQDVGSVAVRVVPIVATLAVATVFLPRLTVPDKYEHWQWGMATWVAVVAAITASWSTLRRRDILRGRFQTAWW
ncbi:hypothetical protein V5P93_003544 [Actinokineospora auranticolor]|uniref:Uncharacterized protein n=1 Tax=Actinokineospora auranticolor TaxID=155976 RepID=A0A2S6GPS8_9PSEU|nr:hypothetical protein [Actinokineospora auranticolor]PPK67206.1 hypothetical protein CLV40_108204 [Actinokineospora auranticolor]